MLRLAKLLAALALLVVFIIFGITVKLGERPLFDHLRAIWNSKESQDLVKGTEQAARPIIDRVRHKVDREPDAGTADAGAPAEKLTDADREKLRRLIGSAKRSKAK